MKIDGRLFIVAIVALVLIPGAYGGAVSVGRGSSVAVSEGSSAEGILASNGLVTQSAVSSSGVIDNLNIDPWVQNTKGDYAEIGVTGTNVVGLTSNNYVAKFSPGEGNGWTSTYVAAQQWVGVVGPVSADSLNAYALASNSAGDKAESKITVNHGSLKGYYSGACAGSVPSLGVAHGAFAQQIVDTATATTGNDVSAIAWATNPSQTAAGTLTDVTSGTLNQYSSFAAAEGTTSGLEATGVSADLKASAPSGSINHVMESYDNTGDLSQGGMAVADGNLFDSTLAWSIKDGTSVTAEQNVAAEGSLIAELSSAGNKEGDISQTETGLSNGQLSTNLDAAIATQTQAVTAEDISKATGDLILLNTHAENTAPGYENKYEAVYNPTTGKYDAVTVPVNYNHGEGDFAAMNEQFNNVQVLTASTSNNVIDVTSTGFGTNTALILDPRRYEFSVEPSRYGIDPTGKIFLDNPNPQGPDIKTPLTNDLLERGYSVTYYSDSAVTKAKVDQMDDYKVSVLHTHMDSYGLSLSHSTDGKTADGMTASELKGAYTANNGMTLMIGCNSFKYMGTGTLADAVSKAQCSGGTTDYWGIGYGSNFLINYFNAMANNGLTAYQANKYAQSNTPADHVYDANDNPIPGQYIQNELELSGSNPNFTL